MKNKGKRWTREDDERLRELLSKDLYHKEIADILGRSLTAVRKRVEKLDDAGRGYRIWTPEEDERLAELVQAGFTRKEIATILNRSYKTVNWRCSYKDIRMPAELAKRNRSVSTNKRLYWNESRLAELKRLVHDEDKTNTEIAGHFGVSVDAVERILYKKKIHRTKQQLEARARAREGYETFYPEYVERVKEMFDSGMLMKDISEQAKISPSALTRLKERQGWEREEIGRRMGRKRKKVPFTELFNAYMVECLPKSEVRKRFGMTSKRLDEELDRHGIVKRTRKERLEMYEEFKDTGRTYNRLSDWREKQ